MASLKKAPKGTLRKVFSYIKPYGLLIFLSITLALFSVALSLWIPLRIGHAIDLIVGAGDVDFENIALIFIEVLCAVLLTALFQWLGGMINNRVTYDIVRDIRNEAFARIQRLPLSYTDTHPSGETVSRIIADADTFADGLLIGFTQLFTGILTILGSLVFMLITSWQIAIAVVILTPLSLFIARFISTRTYSMFRLQASTRGEQTALIEEMIGNAKVVKAFSHEDEALDAFDEVNARLEKCSLRAIFFSSLTNPTTRFVNNVIYAVVALFGAIAVIGGEGMLLGTLTVGTLTALLSYVNQYTKPFNEISGVITEFANALASGARVFELIEEPTEIPDAKDAKVLSEAAGNVSLTDVSFSYTDDKPLIEHLTLTAGAGRRIAIVGPTGCGKTTLINLLMRFYDVKSGKISVEGFDIRTLTRSSLRQNYGMVLQDTWIKNASVRDNIAIGKPDATDEEIIAAAKAAHAHSFIKRLPAGYDTVIGEELGGLSAGQKQLLCITRVMLALPPMLILDEATSSIDTRTELRIQRAFAKMMEGRTSFIVAHRLSTVREADIILVMRDGHIVEQGSHRELLSRGGFYSELYNSQFAH